MNAKRIENVKLASKAIPANQFDSLAQMQRFRRLVEKYHNSPLILLGGELDFIDVAIAFKHLDNLDMSDISKLATYEAIFTTFKKPRSMLDRARAAGIDI